MAVYIIRQADTGLAKIGVSDNPPKRMAELQTGSPHKLTIARHEDAWSYPEERWLHAHYAATRKHGEWFEWRDSMVTIEMPGDVRTDDDHRRQIKADMLKAFDGASMDSLRAALHVVQLSADAETLRKAAALRCEREAEQKTTAEAAESANHNSAPYDRVLELLTTRGRNMTAREIAKTCRPFQSLTQADRDELLTRISDDGKMVATKTSHTTKYKVATK